MTSPISDLFSYSKNIRLLPHELKEEILNKYCQDLERYQPNFQDGKYICDFSNLENEFKNKAEYTNLTFYEYFLFLKDVELIEYDLNQESSSANQSLQMDYTGYNIFYKNYPLLIKFPKCSKWERTHATALNF